MGRRSSQAKRRQRHRNQKPGCVSAKKLSERLQDEKAKKGQQLVQRNYERLKKEVLSLFTREEIEELAHQCGFYRRTPKEIRAFEFVLCAALATVTEAKRGFASVWRMLAAAADIEVARSAVTQRFGPGSAALMQAVFLRIVQRLPNPTHPELLDKLQEFDAVLARDGSVLALRPLLKKLFPATRTHTMNAAAKLHATADLVHRRILDVKVTGERESELAVARSQPIAPNTLHINDLGYTSYDYLAEIHNAQSDALMRLKDNANPTLLTVIHGIRAPKRSQGMKLNDVDIVASQNSFDVLAEFPTSNGSIVLRVVGLRNPNTGKYHRYVTTIMPGFLTVEEIATLYALRWVIELLFKLLKSSFHLDHLVTEDPHAVRTHIYASLSASVIFTALTIAAAAHIGIHPSRISPLVVGIAAPLVTIPLLFLWLERELTHDELAGMILGCCIRQHSTSNASSWFSAENLTGLSA